MAAMCDEKKLAIQMAKAMGHSGFRPGWLAASFMEEPAPIHEAYWENMLAQMRIWADWYDNGVVDEDSPLFNICARSRLVLDIVSPSVQ